jgi:hypothetical protein
MSKFTPGHLVNVFSELGLQMADPNEAFSLLIEAQQHYNPWFTPVSVLHAVKAIGAMLNKGDLINWLNTYEIAQTSPKRVGLILAGNIPLVGFHDVLCVLVSGNFALIKASSQDSKLITHVLKLLTAIEPAFSDNFEFVERLEKFDVVIATGSNNSSRYFEYYFGKAPHIIRKNRSSIALLTGNETTQQLHALGHDIFDYYGLGCRNVSKLLVPKDYSFNHFFESIENYSPTGNHHKYANNYDYNKTIFLVNSDQHLDNGFLLLKEDNKLASPLAVLYFEYYDNLAAAESVLEALSEQIQCIVTAAAIQLNGQVVGFGKSQQPKLWDYADGIDTMAFLTGLN